MVIISELGLESDAYSNFINSINSEFTKKNTTKSFLTLCNSVKNQDIKTCYYYQIVN